MKLLKELCLIVCLALTAACGGGGGDTTGTQVAPKSYTLKVSGGTLNDGTPTAGLAVLATLRDSQGTGPGLTGGWTVTISGPGLARPLSVPYQDGAQGSYEVWRWGGVNPAAGTYTATASNGTATVSSTFTVGDAGIQQPPLTKSGSTVSWTPVSGAGSYYWAVTDGSGSTVASNYIVADASATYSFQLPALSDGSYSVEVVAHAANLPLLGADATAAPALPSWENVSSSSISFVAASGGSGSYDLIAKGGTLYMGKDSSGTDRYGLAVWTSLLTSTGTPPAASWTVSVTGPNISTPLTFSYPATDSHHLYWDFGTVPAAGTYTVTATASGSSDSVSAQFSIPSPAAQLPAVSGISVTTTDPNGYTVAWNAVPGAASYYVNVWGMVAGVYTEVAGAWLSGGTFSALIPKGALTSGTQYDVYITAATLDMTTVQSVPPPAPAQVNMSDNTFAAASFTAQ